MSLHGLWRVAAAIPLLATLPILSSCGQLSSKGSLGDPETGVAKNLGCIQGMVIDGLTGKTVNLANFDAAKGEGLRVVVGDTTLTPGAANEDTLKARDLNGHYTVCNIPLDEQYPVVISVPGYQRIEGMIRVRSTIDALSKEAQQDIQKLVPIETVNLRLFPVGVQTSDLKFVVTEGGLPQKGAKVILTPSGGNTLALDGANIVKTGTSGTLPDGDASVAKPDGSGTRFVDDTSFLIPQNVSGAPLAAETDDLGNAVFAAKDLILGAAMDYKVIPATTALSQTVANGAIHVGLLSSSGVQHPYLVYVDLKNPLPKLAVGENDWISSNLKDIDFIESGEALIYFNREIDQVPGTFDNVTARLVDDNGAELKPDIPGNNRADMVNVEIVGNMLRLTPNWNVKPDRTSEGGLKIIYTGLSLRAKDSPGTADAKTLQNVTVNIFGGVTPEQIPTAFGVPSESGNTQTGIALSDLSSPISVRVLDQFGKVYKKPYQVVFTSTSGHGTLRGVDSGTSSGSLAFNATTDDKGFAKAIWRLGNLNGAQTVTVTAVSLKPIVFTATANPMLKNVSVSAGDRQSGAAGVDLGQAIEVFAVDQNNDAFPGEVSVTFAVDTTVGGAVRAVGTEAASSITTVKSKNGRAAVIWTLGSRSGAQYLTITSGNFPTMSVTANATPVFDGLTTLSGDGLQINPNTDIPLVVQLKDQSGADLRVAGKYVTFQVTAGSGTLLAIGTGPGTATTIQVQSDANGQAKANFNLANNSVGVSFQVRASHEGKSTNFNGTVLAKATALDKTGDFQDAPLNTELTTPIVVQLKDQDGNILRRPNVEITFAITTTGGVAGTLRRDGSSATTYPVQVLTDSDGQARIFFKITAGTVDANYEISATPNVTTAPGVLAVKFTGKIKAALQ